MDYYILELEDYCNECPEFDVTVRLKEAGPDTMGSVFRKQKVINCSHKKRCRNMVNWLNKKLEKEN